MAERIIPVLALAALAGVLYECTTTVSGVETTNGFTVTATSSSIEGTAPPLSQVFIFDTNYIPYIDSGIGLGTSADQTGNYRIATQPGSYNVFVVTPQGDAGGVAGETILPGDMRPAASQSHTMERPGSISGSVTGASSDRLLIYLAGMCHYHLISEARDFHFTAVPPGTYRLRIARLPDTGPIIVLHERAVTVARGEAMQTGAISIER